MCIYIYTYVYIYIYISISILLDSYLYYWESLQFWNSADALVNHGLFIQRNAPWSLRATLKEPKNGVCFGGTNCGAVRKLWRCQTTKFFLF